MAIDLLAKPVVDALLKAFDRAKDARLRTSARKAIGEAISELIRINPDLSKAQAKIAVARAAGILDQDLFTAERMLKKVKKANRKATQPGGGSDYVWGPCQPVGAPQQRRTGPSARTCGDADPPVGYDPSAPISAP